MDTLHFEPRSFHSPQVGRMFGDQPVTRIDDLNLSELEVFMLRGRRLQALAMGEALREVFTKLGRLLRGSGDEPGSRHPDCHGHA
jgi:hypothetical protein